MPRRDRPQDQDDQVTDVELQKELDDAYNVLDDDVPEYWNAADPQFDPYSEGIDNSSTIHDIIQIKTDLEHFMYKDIKGNLQRETDLGPTSLKFIEARVEHVSEAIENLNAVIADVAAAIKLTDLHGEWRDWWMAR